MSADTVAIQVLLRGGALHALIVGEEQKGHSTGIKSPSQNCSGPSSNSCSVAPPVAADPVLLCHLADPTGPDGLTVPVDLPDPTTPDSGQVVQVGAVSVVVQAILSMAVAVGVYTTAVVVEACFAAAWVADTAVGGAAGTVVHCMDMWRLCVPFDHM